MGRRGTTPKSSAASSRNLRKAQVSRVRRHEPRQLGRIRPARTRARM